MGPKTPYYLFVLSYRVFADVSLAAVLVVRPWVLMDRASPIYVVSCTTNVPVFARICFVVLPLLNLP